MSGPSLGPWVVVRALGCTPQEDGPRRGPGDMGGGVDSAEPAHRAAWSTPPPSTLAQPERLVLGQPRYDLPSPACDERVWRMDVGMAAYYGGQAAALEVVDCQVSLLE